MGHFRQLTSMAAAGKTLTPKVMAAVEQAFEKVFGPYCGWAHNTLFISDLASQRHRLPPHLGGTLQSPAVVPSSSQAAATAGPLPTANRTAASLTDATDTVKPDDDAAAAAADLDISRLPGDFTPGQGVQMAAACAAAQQASSKELVEEDAVKQPEGKRHGQQTAARPTKTARSRKSQHGQPSRQKAVLPVHVP